MLKENQLLQKSKSTYQAPQPARLDVVKLERELRRAIAGEVRFDDGSRALYATDASNYRQVPIGVVLPKNETDIVRCIDICRRHGAPVLSRGGGTSLAGQCCNVAVVMDLSKYYNKVLRIDDGKKTVTVQTGIVLDEMKKAVRKQNGLTFGPDPATHSHCTLGGMLGNNSCGVHSVMSALEGHGARTSDNTASLTVLTYEGLRLEVGPTSDEEYERILRAGGKKAVIYRQLRALRDKYADLIRERFPRIPRRVSGYNLPQLLPENGFNVARALVGSEGTCVTILEATMQLMPDHTARALLVLGYKDVYAAAADVPEILPHGPTALEGMDDILVEYMEKKGLNVKDIPLLPEGKGWLIVEFGADSQEAADAKAQALVKALQSREQAPSVKRYDDPELEKRLWEVRESGLGATAWIPGEPMSVPGWEDSAVPPERVSDYLKDLRRLFDKYGYNPSVYGHFGQGCVHCRVQFDLFSEAGLEQYKAFTQEAAQLVVGYGGSLSGEHGDGQSRADLLDIMYGSELMEAFRAFKDIWDPLGGMNPGKIVRPYGQLSDLRLNNEYNPPQPATYFHYPDDKNSFAHATLRCVGVGECRRHEGKTMCPSYRVTREEKHSTRGRARLLFEMLDGGVIKNGWRDEQVKESLDLCLACKGCKSDCPVNVDMATYKAEFLAHYYHNRARPRSAYVFGWIDRWSRLAMLAPRLVNFLLHAPVTGGIAKAVAGVDQRRSMPRYADVSFREWYRHIKKSYTRTGKPKVILWADTFNNYFLPETLVAGREVLEAAGWEVVIPRQALCCGRPLYDFGMLDSARRRLRQIMQSLRREIREGMPIVGLEPSCVAVFRDELINLFPNDYDARRLHDNVYTLAEFLARRAPDFQVPQIDGSAIVHGHCHHKAVMKMDEDKKLLQKTGLQIRLPDDGCCGMAGYFGYEKGDRYNVSVAVAGQALAPAVRAAGDDCLVIADGFSCREQILQQTPRRALHLAQVLQMGLQGGRPRPPEKKQGRDRRLRDPDRNIQRVATAAGFMAGLLAAFIIKNRRR